MKILLKAYPNGEVNSSVVRVKRVKLPFIPPYDLESIRIVKETVKAVGIDAAIALISEGKVFGVSPRTLCLSTVAISRNPKGSSGLTRHGRRQIECGTVLLEKKSRRDCLSFLTLTLPLSLNDDEGFDSLAIAKNRFTTWLIRHLTAAGLPDWYVGVVEPHPARSVREGRMVPHYHICFVGRRPGKTWALTPQQIKDAWYQCLVNAGLCPQGGDSSACANVQRVRKSVSRYMGKYMSKTRASNKLETSENLAKTHPGTWHLISRSLVKLIKQSIKHRFGTEAQSILNWIDEPDNPWVLYKGSVDLVASDGHRFSVGTYAKVNLEVLRWL